MPQPRRDMIRSKKTQVSLGITPTEYTSIAGGSFLQWPKDFKRARPVKKREELLVTNFELGQEKTQYQTSCMDRF